MKTPRPLVSVAPVSDAEIDALRAEEDLEAHLKLSGLLDEVLAEAKRLAGRGRVTGIDLAALSTIVDRCSDAYTCPKRTVA